VIDRRRVTILSTDEARTHVLEGSEATVWEWVSVSTAQPRLVEFVAQLTGTDAAEARAVVDGLFSRWRDAGLLVPASLPGRTRG
jgi:hypothetical protein